MFVNVINKIRDILRAEGITTKDSISYCIGFLVIRLLDDKMCQKLNIDVKYSFNNLINCKSKNELYEKIYNPGSNDFLILHLIQKVNLSFLKGFKLKSTENLYNILSLLKDLDIDKLNEQYDLIGIIYELHLKTGSNGSSMRDLGQYFTNRRVIDYMIKIVDPELNETICDPTMGTGGFLIMCIKYLNSKYNINWKEYKNLLYGFDIDEDIKNLAGLNLLLETGFQFNTINIVDTLQNDLLLSNGQIVDKVKVILANEPMGLKNLNYDKCCNKIKNLQIKGNKCESLFMQLFMQSLDINGRCCVIIPDGFLFSDNAVQQKTREYLINNFDLKKVISLNGDFFVNTNVKTSILYFINNGQKTEKVEFCELIYGEQITENKIMEISYNDIVNNNYYLLVNKYINDDEDDEVPVYYKLKDICDFVTSSQNSESLILEDNKLKIGIPCNQEIIEPKYQDILIKYLYYRINKYQDKLTKEFIENLDIPILSLNGQQKFIEMMDDLFEIIDKTKELINLFKKQICMFVKNATEDKEKIKINLSKVEDKIKGKILFKDDKLFISDGQNVFMIAEDKITTKYIYYYLKSNSKLDYANLEIPKIEDEDLKTLVEDCENLENMIKELNEHIKFTKYQIDITL